MNPPPTNTTPPDRPPLPRSIVAWEHHTVPTIDRGDPAFVRTDDDLTADRRAIHAAVASQGAWFRTSYAWITQHGYTFGEWQRAREAAQGLTAQQCAAVAIVNDEVVVLTARDLDAMNVTPPGGESENNFENLPGRHSPSDPVTPETDATPRPVNP
jgi:hypothetical protein